GLQPRQPRLSHRLRAAAPGDPEGGLAGDLERPGAGPPPPGPLSPGLHLRGLRRSVGAPPAGGLLGEREPGGPARLLRRGEALRRGPLYELLPGPRASGAHRAHLQYLRPPDAAGRWAGGPGLPVAGRRREAADGVRRWEPDPGLLLRRRSHRGPPPALALRRGGAGEPGSSRGDPPAHARRGGGGG